MVVKVIDDVVSKGYQNLIENTICSDNFDWNYITGLTFDDDSNTGFVNKIFSSEHQFRTPYADLLIPLLYEAIDKYEKGLVVKDLYRIIARMNLKGQNKSKHIPHIDVEFPHYTMVYYVNDSDLGTNIHEGDKIIQNVEHKKGRAVIMSGDVLHSSSTPKKSLNRVVLNFNFMI
tara:strand:- start:692 stop:1213 length:522 start_codon:yes stop_codon:yes gene_type:complete